MAYDEELASRIRSLVADEAALSEQRMFGGLAFLLHGNMAVAASGQGGLLVRVDPDESDALREQTPARALGSAPSKVRRNSVWPVIYEWIAGRLLTSWNKKGTLL